MLLSSAPISYFQAIVLGLVQGVSELFPISSIGHIVILPRLLGWNIHQNAPYFLSFLVAVHLATALVLLGFFWQDWVRIVAGMLRSLRDRELADDNPTGKLGWLLVVGTIPAGILGLLFESSLRSAFASARFAAAVLMANGLMLYGAELLRRRAPEIGDGTEGYPGEGDERVAKRTSWSSTVGIGAAQALALLPGFSRSGATMSGGLLAGLSNEDAARFSFLLATPIISAAALLKLPDLVGSTGNGVRGQAVAAALCAAITAYLSLRFLMRYFQTSRLTPFAIYSILVGAVCTAYLL